MGGVLFENALCAFERRVSCRFGQRTVAQDISIDSSPNDVIEGEMQVACRTEQRAPRACSNVSRRDKNTESARGAGAACGASLPVEVRWYGL